MAKNNKYGLTDEQINELLSRYLSGGSLTAQEKSVMAKIARENPEVAQFIVQQKRNATNGGVATAGGAQNAQRKQMNQVLANKNSSLGNRYAPKSPGGFKESGLDYDSQTRESGMLTAAQQGDADPRRARIFNDGTAFVNGRKYTQREVQAVLQRAQSGATLGGNDQKIYDRYVGIMQAREQQRMLRDQQMRQAAAERRNQISQMRIDPDSAEGQRLAAMKDFDFSQFQVNRANDALRRQQAFAAEANRKAARDKVLAEGVGDIKKIPEGYSYTEGQVSDFNKLRQEYAAVLNDPKLNDEDRKEAAYAILEKMRSIKGAPVMDMEQKKTPQQKLDENLVTITDEDGQKIRGTFVNGEFKAIPRAKDEKAKEYDAYEEKMRLEQKRDDELEAKRYDEYVNKRMDALMEPRIVGKEEVFMSYDDALKKAKEEANVRYGIPRKYQKQEGDISEIVDVPKEEESVVPTPANAPSPSAPKTDWRNSASFAQMVSDEEAFVGDEVCKVCGEQLNLDGTCPNGHIQSNKEGE